MNLLNRDLQRRLLTELSEIYPSAADMGRSFRDLDERQVQYNLFYLAEHNLVSIKARQLLSGEYPIASATITAAGIDFITDDGGLSSVLSVVTVKLHEDTLKALLIQKVEASGASPTIKQSLIQKIRSLPAEGLGKLTERALEAGLDQIPDLAGELSKWIGS